MSDLLAARTQMALSLGFHIIFAEIGIAMPLLMVLAEWRWRRTGDVVYLQLAKRWAKGSAVLFAVGAVSGTVLSFELGLLWPHFMKFAGPIVGIPFSLEGFAFFTEAIFLGVYLYGWEKIPARAHLLAGVIVAASGAASAIFVVMVNAWMNTPTGFTLENGSITSIDPIAGMLNPSTLHQAIHMLIAAYAATGLAVAGIHAAILLHAHWHHRAPSEVARHPEPNGAALSSFRFHRHALVLALAVGAPAAILQPVSGDQAARSVARWQPVKLAALEGNFKTERGAPLRIGGWPDERARVTRYAIEIPYGLSLLAFHDPDARVIGLEHFAPEYWPPVIPVHLAFQLMVGLGTAMAIVSIWAIVVLFRRPDALAEHRALLRALAIVTPFGFLATEAGWAVTEIGRQPWVVNGVIRTADAVTPMTGLAVPMALFTLLYLGLSAVVVLVVRSIVRETTEIVA
jgi:cytochrome d ubiquinol oxidase subunit I